MTGQAWRLGHRPALDGLRGVAILLVVGAHGLTRFEAGGTIGVTVFFTLSGFLITALLLEERERRGRISLIDFYRRRLLRLLPALTLLVGVLVACSMTSIVGAAAALLYVGNWIEVDTAGPGLGGLAHTWSLAVEEQFYIIWPVVLIATARLGRGALLAVALAGSMYAIVARAALWDNSITTMRRIYLGTDMHADALLVGCALAVILCGSHRRATSRRTVVVLALVAIAALGFPQSMAIWFVLNPTLVPLLAAVAIFCLTTGTRLRLLESRAFVVIGRRSYGLYLWHVPVFAVGSQHLEVLPHFISFALLVGVSWLVTSLSWRYVERPFLRLKESRVTAPLGQRVDLHDGRPGNPAGRDLDGASGGRRVSPLVGVNASGSQA